MKTRPLSVSCPICGSESVVYSCQPDCCFNHVCGDCLASFQLETRALGGKISDIAFEAIEPDSCAPTVRCARCESLNVRMIDGEDPGAKCLVCEDCLTVLKLEYA